MRIRAIITGATGMIGEGVVHECIHHPHVESIMLVNRRPSGITHPKVREIIHTNFHDLSPIESQLSGYNACFFCLGVSSIGLDEIQYHHLTHGLTLHVATILLKHNPDMTFCYVSGTGTSSSEKGAMWARVKGKTENDLLKMKFKDAYMFRPGFIKPTKGLKNTLKLYSYFGWMFPILNAVAPKYVCTLKEIGLAMIHSVVMGYEKKVLEVKDIRILAGRTP